MVAERLLPWFAEHRRPLPWRESPTPYRVWVSEIMLQQTRIEAVIPYFERFMQAFPDIPSLAAADPDRLMKLWEGLGYYSRARHLQKAAQQVVSLYNGELPKTYAQLKQLAGIGDYTAGAIASIAFGEAVPAVDGNVLRVMARVVALHENVMLPDVKRRLTEEVCRILPTDHPGEFNQALMELGETVCLPNTEPKCAACPLNDICAARAEGSQKQLPIRSKAKERRIENRTVMVIVSKENPCRVLLHQRPNKGLLAGLWELPNVFGTVEDKEANGFLRAIGGEATSVSSLITGKHIFTHIEWHLSGFLLYVKPFVAPDGYAWATVMQLYEQYALPGAFRTYSALLPILMKGEKA